MSLVKFKDENCFACEHSYVIHSALTGCCFKCPDHRKCQRFIDKKLMKTKLGRAQMYLMFNVWTILFVVVILAGMLLFFK